MLQHLCCSSLHMHVSVGHPLTHAGRCRAQQGAVWCLVLRHDLLLFQRHRQCCLRDVHAVRCAAAVSVEGCGRQEFLLCCWMDLTSWGALQQAEPCPLLPPASLFRSRACLEKEALRKIERPVRISQQGQFMHLVFTANISEHDHNTWQGIRDFGCGERQNLGQHSVR